MTDYFITNFLITSSVLATLKILQSGPANINLGLLFFAVLSWFVPWEMVGLYTTTLVPDALYINVADIFSAQTLMPAIENLGGSRHGTTSASLTFPKFEYLPHGLIIGALFIGGVFFTLRIYAYYKLIKRLYRNSLSTTKYSDMAQGYPVRIASLGTPAMATGILHPLIWLDHSMEDRSEIASILHHEVTHVRLGDIYCAWFLCLFESFFGGILFAKYSLNGLRSNWNCAVMKDALPSWKPNTSVI